jgi:MFS family permease
MEARALGGQRADEPLSRRGLGDAAGRVAVRAAAARQPVAAATDRASRDASITLGLTLPTDTVLYLLLPLHPAAFGVTLAEAGLLLAANRLVRIAGYRWVARGYERRGPRAACIAAVLGAALSSLGYALLPPGMWWLLPARLVWGLSFAALNIATQALPTAEAEGMARRSGRSRAVIAAGPMVGLVLGAATAEIVGARPVFLVLAAVAILGLPFALRLPGGAGQAVRGGPRLALPTRLDLWSFVQGMALDGLFVVGLSVLAARAVPANAALAAGAALALRYAAEIALGPPGGAGRALRRGPAARLGHLGFGGGIGCDRRRPVLGRGGGGGAAARPAPTLAGASGRGSESRRGAGAGACAPRHLARPRRRPARGGFLAAGRPAPASSRRHGGASGGYRGNSASPACWSAGGDRCWARRPPMILMPAGRAFPAPCSSGPGAYQFDDKGFGARCR